MIKCKEPCPAHEEQRCCCFCPERNDCPDECGQNHTDCGMGTECPETPALQDEKAVALMKSIQGVALKKREIEAQEKEMRERLKSAMEESGILSIDNEYIKVSYIKEGTQTRIDSVLLKGKYPQIAAECSKTSKTSAYIKIEVKERKNG